MKKLLRKLFFWLFKEDFERMNKLESDLKGLIHRQKCATQEAEVRAERIRWGTLMFQSMFIIVQAHGRLYPYRVRRPTTLNSSTSGVET